MLSVSSVTSACAHVRHRLTDRIAQLDNLLLEIGKPQSILFAEVFQARHQQRVADRRKLHFAFGNNAVDDLRINLLLADISDVTPQLRDAAEVLKNLGVGVFNVVKILETFQRILDEAQLRHGRAVAMSAFGTADGIIKSIVLVELDAVIFQKRDHLVEIKTLQRRGSEDDDVLIIQILEPPAYVIENAIDGLLNFGGIALVDAIDGDEQRIKFILILERRPDLLEEFHFVVGKMRRIIHHEDAHVGGVDALFGDLLMFRARARKIRSGRVPNFVAVELVARIINIHVGQAGALAGFVLRAMKFLVDEIMQRLRAVVDRLLPFVFERQGLVDVDGNVFYDIGRRQF